MLTFELSSDPAELIIHADHKGLQQLQKQIDFLLKGSSHVHLMTPAWGGTELSEDRQDESATLLNKVTIYSWQEPPS
jgi:hypothetical protein